MGKVYANIIAMTKLENRTKKDGSGQYEYADLTLQLYDKDANPSTHKVFDWRTGALLKEEADVIVYDCVRDSAVALSQKGFAIGEIVIAEISAGRSQYGRNEIKVTNVEHQQPRPNTVAPR